MSAKQPQPPARTPEMIEQHQHWVWMGGAEPPRWEIRGTGVVLDDETLAILRRIRELEIGKGAPGE